MMAWASSKLDVDVQFGAVAWASFKCVVDYTFDSPPRISVRECGRASGRGKTSHGRSLILAMSGPLDFADPLGGPHVVLFQDKPLFPTIMTRLEKISSGRSSTYSVAGLFTALLVFPGLG